jgi:hypothetical protein
MCLVPSRPAEAASLTTIYKFAPSIWPMTGLVSGPGGALYGATNKTIYELVQETNGKWQEKTIFGTGAATLVGSTTALYAATNTGNTVFELDPPAKGSTVWKGTVLHVFKGDKDGSEPLGLALASDGSLYGTTQLGGGASACGSMNGVPTGCGTFFRLSKVNGKWVELLIHAFEAGADGANPVASPSFDAAGNVYLTTSAGGLKSAKLSGVAPALISSYRSPRNAAPGCGDVIEFAIKSGVQVQYQEDLEDLCDGIWKVRMAYPESEVWNSFAAGFKQTTSMFPFAATPADEVIFSTVGGGDQSEFCLETSFAGCGNVAEMSRTSAAKPWEGKVLHEFSGSDGFGPSGALTADGSTKLYGVAGSAVGKCPNQGCGEVFVLNLGKTGWAWEGVLYRFTTDVFPVPQLTLYKGKLLGTTGGYNVSPGTVYELTL